MTGTGSSGDAGFPMRRSDVEWTELDGETVLYDPKANMMHSLNASAAVVWAACDGTVAAHEIVRAIETDYSGDRNEIERDVLAIIEQFRRQGLLDLALPDGAG
jgi:hypothetical protein